MTRIAADWLIVSINHSYSSLQMCCVFFFICGLYGALTLRLVAL